MSSGAYLIQNILSSHVMDNCNKDVNEDHAVHLLVIKGFEKSKLNVLCGVFIYMQFSCSPKHIRVHPSGVECISFLIKHLQS